MSEFTLRTIVKLALVVISFLSKGLRSLYAIIDIVDDGIINDSADKPVWYQSVCEWLSQLEDILGNLKDTFNA